MVLRATKGEDPLPPVRIKRGSGHDVVLDHIDRTHSEDTKILVGFEVERAGWEHWPPTTSNSNPTNTTFPCGDVRSVGPAPEGETVEGLESIENAEDEKVTKRGAAEADGVEYAEDHSQRKICKADRNALDGAFKYLSNHDRFHFDDLEDANMFQREDVFVTWFLGMVEKADMVGRKLLRKGPVVAAVYTTYKMDRNAAVEFWAQIGSRSRASDGPSRLRTYLSSVRIPGSWEREAKVTKVSWEMIYSKCIQAWEHFLADGGKHETESALSTEGNAA